MEGRALALLDAELFLPQNFSALRVDGAKVARAAHLINGVADENGRAGERTDAVAPYFQFLRRKDGRLVRIRLRDALRNPETGHATNFTRIQIFAFMHSDDRVAIGQHGCVDAAFRAALGRGDAPNRFARPRIQRHQRTITRRRIQNAFAIPPVQPRMRKRIVLRPCAGRR